MNKFGLVLGVAAVATLAGCKDPGYKHAGTPSSQNDVKSVDTAEPATVEPVVVEPAVKKCQCPPGTKHAEPCKCGAPDCSCIVEVKPVIVADLSKPAPVEPEYTVYVVQNGDYLAKISKKFNVTISSIKRLNPSIKKDVIMVGQKLKLPGKIDLSAEKYSVTAAPVKAAAPAAKSAKGAAAYKGETKEYVVKNGDTLGAIAYGHGINIRQLKELNGLASDSLKIGQKLRVPAQKVEKPAASAKPAAPVAQKPAAPAKPVEEPAVQTPAAPADAVPPTEDPAADVVPPVEEPAANVAPVETAADKTDAAPAKAEAAANPTYVVQEGDDMTGVCVRWGVSAAEIRELNNLAEGDQLVPGQIIKLPVGAEQ